MFLGGAVVGLFITERGGLPARVTTDVDVAIKVGGFLSEIELDRRMIELGFRNEIAGPTCRYLRDSTVLDVIPVRPESQDDDKSWLRLAIETAEPHVLANGIAIRVVSPIAFLATKMAAFRSTSREHHDDAFLSRDFEDIVRVIDGRPEIADELSESREVLRRFIRDQFRILLDASYIEFAIAEHADPGREKLVLERIRTLAS